MNKTGKIAYVLEAIRSYLEGTYSEDVNYPFYLELEMELLIDNYDEMYKENQEVTLLMNEELPDICAAVGEISVDEFKRLLKIEYDKVAKLYYG